MIASSVWFPLFSRCGLLLSSGFIYQLGMVMDLNGAGSCIGQAVPSQDTHLSTEQVDCGKDPVVLKGFPPLECVRKSGCQSRTEPY